MKVSEWLAPFFNEETLPNLDILSFSNDSRNMTPGMAFLAFLGEKNDGRLYIEKACEKGASLVLYDPKNMPRIILPSDIPCLPITDLKDKLSTLAIRFYENPGAGLHITGVTGTNGKTTIAWQLALAKERLALKSAYIGTLGHGVPSHLTPLLNTTPDPITLQSFFKDCEKNRIFHLAMEVSSHALMQKRVEGIRFEQAIFTNLTQDHLDYHGTMQAYGEAKARLFSSPGLREAIINVDDESSQIMMRALSKETHCLSYGFSPKASVQVIQYERVGSTTKIELVSPWGRHTLSLPLLGRFSVYNALAVFAGLMLEGHDIEAVKSVMETLPQARGRLEIVATHPLVIVDYAHTPDALQNVLQTLKTIKTGRLWVIFGCGGDRDCEKRPLMGEIAARLADVVMVTSDNPRTEAKEVIISDILGGIPKDTTHLLVEIDRKKAITEIVKTADPSDIILIAGKGHESYQEIEGVRLPFSDQAIAISAHRER